MMGLTHMQSLKKMCPLGYVGPRSTHDIGIYKLHNYIYIYMYIYIHTTQSAQILQKQHE